MSKKLPLLQEILSLVSENAAHLPPLRPLPVLRDFPSERTSFPFTGRNPTLARSPFRPPHAVPVFPPGPPPYPRRSALSSLIPRPAEAKQQSIASYLSNR